MPARSFLGFLILLAATAPSACRAPEAERKPVADSTASVAGGESGAVGTSPIWYSRTRTLDLTGDGRADTVRLQAVGTRPESLAVALSMIVGGEVKNRVAWESSYELAMADSATGAGPSMDAFLRARLDSVLASVVVQRLDAPGVQVMAEDSAVLATLDPPPSQRISFAYGYETVVRMVWDATRARFVPLWSCC